ncbi:MAG: fatty acyl-AMP ligase [Moorea sp. SIO4G2]|nr:fatty acyl-AMP ligase [Moorena sp. SIO4A3]NEO66610.1 fatty acyl-AMP ligase [Moorena sp. SIO4G2]
MITIQGRNYYFQDIERTVETSHPSLRRNFGAAFTIEVNGHQRLVVAQEVKQSYQQNLDINEVIEAIAQVLAQHYHLQVYGVLLLVSGTIPKTKRGTILRHACKAAFLTGGLDLVGDWTENPCNKAEFLHLHAEVESLAEWLQILKKQHLFSIKNNPEEYCQPKDHTKLHSYLALSCHHPITPSPFD